MNTFKIFYLFFLLISVNQDFVNSSNYKKKFLDITPKKTYSLNRTLLVQKDSNVKTIIVTGANGDIGISIARILKEYNTEYKIIGTEIGDLWPAKNYFNKIHKIPKAQNDNYFFALKKILSSYENPLIIPTSEPELSVISNDYNRFKKLPLLINKSNIIKTFQDKYLTYKWLTKNNIPVATTYEIKNLNDGEMYHFNTNAQISVYVSTVKEFEQKKYQINQKFYLTKNQNKKKSYNANLVNIILYLRNILFSIFPNFFMNFDKKLKKKKIN